MRMSFINSDLLYRGALYRQVCLYLIYILDLEPETKTKMKLQKLLNLKPRTFDFCCIT